MVKSVSIEQLITFCACIILILFGYRNSTLSQVCVCMYVCACVCAACICVQKTTKEKIKSTSFATDTLYVIVHDFLIIIINYKYIVVQSHEHNGYGILGIEQILILNSLNKTLPVSVGELHMTLPCSLVGLSSAHVYIHEVSTT